MIAFITSNSTLVPSLEDLYSSMYIYLHIRYPDGAWQLRRDAPHCCALNQPPPAMILNKTFFIFNHWSIIGFPSHFSALRSSSSCLVAGYRPSIVLLSLLNVRLVLRLTPQQRPCVNLCVHMPQRMHTHTYTHTSTHANTHTYALSALYTLSLHMHSVYMMPLMYDTCVDICT